MIIATDRSEFNKALAVKKYDFLLLFGKNNALAKSIHDEAVLCAEEWNNPVLFEDLTVLTPEEKAAWYKDDATYSTLSRLKKRGTESKRIVVEQLPLTNLCEAGIPAAQKIQGAFGRADAA